MSAGAAITRSVNARRLGADDLPDACAYLQEDTLGNLLLIDLAARYGQAPPPGETATELVGAFRGSELVGVAALRPTIVLDARMESQAVLALLPYVEALDVGLVKSEASRVELLWEQLGRRRRRIWVNRLETALVLEPGRAHLVPRTPDRNVRPAQLEDLEPLVFAARESLREENRPDPFAGDVRGFRRWVRGRIPRALLVEREGRVCFVGYADVRREEGWLLQGIYTWPEERRRGHAALGTSELCREAFAAGARHVQLAVVEGNEAARRLYDELGFEPFARLRTILFT